MAGTLSPLLAAVAEAPRPVDPDRAAALERALERGLPTRADEDWRYLDLRTLAEQPRTLDAGPTPDAGLVAGLAPAFENEIRLVIVDGRLDASLSSPPGSWSSLIGGAGPGSPGWAWGDLAVGLDGAALRLRLAPGRQLGETLHVVHVSTPGAARLTGATFCLELGRSSAARLVESHVGLQGAEVLGCVQTTLRLGADAELRHVKFQDVPHTCTHIAEGRVTIERDARYHSTGVTTGAALSRDTLDAVVTGPGAQTRLAALSFANGGQHIDHHTSLDHTEPDCTSHQLYKAILRGSAHGVFNGKIYVRQAAQRTNADQLSKSLLLSREARVDAKPQLEIFADDVRCTHGATVGQLDAEELFYLMSRAIPRVTAERMLLAGFATDVLAQLADAELERRAAEQIRRAWEV